jgi:hypothetical protein
MAPTCKVCLIREDLTTVWCEVTSSIRTRSVEEESPFDALTAELVGTAPPEPSAKSTSDAPPGAFKEAPKEETVTELLLCLRPIRDGEKKVSESLRFKRGMQEGEQSKQNSSDGAEGRAAVSSSSGGPQNSSENASSNRSRDPAKRPPKKRPHQAQEAADSDGSAEEEQEVLDISPTKKKRSAKLEGAQTPVNASDDTEKSVVESLMLMSNKSQ